MLYVLRTTLDLSSTLLILSTRCRPFSRSKLFVLSTGLPRFDRNVQQRHHRRCELHVKGVRFFASIFSRVAAILNCVIAFFPWFHMRVLSKAIIIVSLSMSYALPAQVAASGGRGTFECIRKPSVTLYTIYNYLTTYFSYSLSRLKTSFVFFLFSIEINNFLCLCGCMRAGDSLTWNHHTYSFGMLLEPGHELQPVGQVENILL